MSSHVCDFVQTPLPPTNKWQTCKCCGVIQQVIWKVPNEVWDKLPALWKSQTLCLECFTSKLKGYAPFSLTVLVHPGLTEKL